MIEEIEGALKDLEEWRDKDIQQDDVENVKASIEKVKTSVMKIGQSMSGQGGQSSENQEQQENEKNENEG